MLQAFGKVIVFSKYFKTLQIDYSVKILNSVKIIKDFFPKEPLYSIMILVPLCSELEAELLTLYLGVSSESLPQAVVYPEYLRVSFFHTNKLNSFLEANDTPCFYLSHRRTCLNIFVPIVLRSMLITEQISLDKHRQVGPIPA